MVRDLGRHMGVYGTLEALKIQAVSRPEQERISVIDCYGRVLSEDIVSPIDLPPLPRSRAAGFAIRSADVKAASSSNRVELDVLEKGEPSNKLQRTGAAYAHPIEEGETLPRGTDAVVLPEDVEISPHTIVVGSPPVTGAHVEAAGAEAKKGETIIRKGTIIRVQEVGLLTLIRSRNVSVFGIPKVAILPIAKGLSGGESAEVLEATSGVMGLLVAGAGGTSLILEGVPDDPVRLSSGLRTALDEADIAIVISDSSETEPDPVEVAIDSFGKPGVVVRSVRMEPGRTTGFGMARGKPVMIVPRSMPGAVSSFVVFIYPLIRNMLGTTFGEPPSVLATLSGGWQVEKRLYNFTKVLYVSLWSGPDGLVAQPLEVLPGQATLPPPANGYVLVPESLGNLTKGAKVWAHLFPGFSYVDARFL